MSRLPIVCRTLTILGTVTTLATSAFGDSPPAPTRPSDKSAVPPVKVTSFGRLPLTFERNTGRYDKRVKFLTRTGGTTVFLTANEMVMVLPGKATGEGRGARSDRDLASGCPSGPSRPSANHVLRMRLVGSNSKSVATGLQKQPGIVNYFIGNDPKKWRTRVPTYARAKLAGVYPWVDVVYYGNEARGKGPEQAWGVRSQPSALEYDFILRPGADPARIQLAFEGADRIRVADGDLILSTPAGDVRMKRPSAYQTIDGRRVQVACDYKLHSPLATHQSPRVAFRLARYDAAKPLVVDPVLVYSTFIGNGGPQRASGVSTDASGAAYVTGSTGSNSPV
ncbi:MAG: hypothetical protein FJX72_21530, partial [Armatimonadetes bacterium]|nr:hypothetical protein [Armatimonadota bacterium]